MVYSADSYFSSTQIPDTWNTLEDFINWYMDSKMPLMIPWDAKVMCTDDATAICIFKKPPYQIELYIIHPNQTIPPHSHPDMEVITMVLGGGKLYKPGFEHLNCGKEWGKLTDKLVFPQTHGGKFTDYSDGYVLLSFEKWLNNTELTSASVQWAGETAGPIHDKLILKHNPSSLIKEGYAVSKVNNV
jgi:hypothetical protein